VKEYKVIPTTDLAGPGQLEKCLNDLAQQGAKVVGFSTGIFKGSAISALHKDEPMIVPVIILERESDPKPGMPLLMV
jgi:hypothetical protein